MTTLTILDALNSAIAHYNDGRFAVAEDIAARVRAVAPHAAAATRLLGLCAERRDDLAAAAGFLAASLAADPAPATIDDSVRVLLELGNRLRAGRDLVQAAVRYRQAAVLAPERFEPYNNLGSVHKEQGHPDTFVCYERALAIDPAQAGQHGHLRMVALRRLLLRTCGPQVLSGPFAGMAYDGSSAEGWYLPRMLGCYEQELHPHLRALAERGYETVINIGCAEGYYAVGLARLLPGARIFAHDLNENAQAACRRLAALNGVGDRVTVGGLFDGPMFDRFAGRPTLLVCDIEGSERDLLDPARFPALAGIDVVVELHDCYEVGLSSLIQDRFAPTHDVLIVGNDPQRILPALPLLAGLTPFERSLLIGEFRAGATPWGVLRARAPGERAATPL